MWVKLFHDRVAIAVGAEATEQLIDWRLAPVWQQMRAELARHTRKPRSGSTCVGA